MTGSRLFFGITVFLASFLLFLVEPMAARQLLPVYGGAAAVWITCLVFFQAALLAAYLYAHWLAQRPRSNTHFLLLPAAAASAIAWSIWTMHQAPVSGNPMLGIFAALALTIGLPFLALGAASPLLQVWAGRVEAKGIPYRLYALSNLASLLALGLYPSVIEPYLTLKLQRALWCCCFAAFAAIFAALAWKTRSLSSLVADDAYQDAPEFPRFPLRNRILWFLLPMGAAMQLSAVTGYLTANIAAIPLLWILPLAVYLVTLILVFQLPQFLPRSIVTRLMVVMLAGLGYMLSQVDASLPIRIGMIFFLAELFTSCLFCHLEAYALRPRRRSEITLFYLLFAAGGALGSFLVGIVLPLIFRFNYDLALTFFVTALLALAAAWQSGWAQRLLWSTCAVLMLALVFVIHFSLLRDTTAAVRNFYGALRVRQAVGYPNGAVLRTLSNGTIQHGTQIFSPALRTTPTAYYAEDSGVGLALRYCCSGRPRNIGVVGLGVGTIAAYGRPGDRIRFYEINPAVTPIARNLFTYIHDSAAQVDIVEGDARSSLASESPRKFDVLVIDAFSGDAIPIHLLTAEAVALYKRHLVPGGILAFHISNQHVDLEPQIALLASSAGMRAMRVSSIANEQRGEFNATWMLASEDPQFFAQPEVETQARRPATDPKLRLWTDDYSSLLPILRW